MIPPAPSPIPTAIPSPNVPPSLFLATYFPWFDAATWSSGVISDLPTELYNSDDPSAIARHIRQAQQAQINGFVSAWLLPGNRTDRNFATLLERSRGSSFQSAVLFLTNVLPDQSRESLIQALRHIIGNYGGHPNYLRWQGKPVIFFSDMPRVPLSGEATPQEAWAAIRRAVDPENSQVWIAEGLDPSYLSVFDGLYVFKIAHRCCPDDYLKLPRWGRQVRAYGQDKLWIATTMPGWDDLRTVDQTGGLREPSPPSARDRENGAYYRRTYQTALSTGPDWLLINSFNEWVEGSQIEPSRRHGDYYLNVTRDLIAGGS